VNECFLRAKKKEENIFGRIRSKENGGSTYVYKGKRVF
jgi:hypothetical protein